MKALKEEGEESTLRVERGFANKGLILYEQKEPIGYNKSFYSFFYSFVLSNKVENLFARKVIKTFTIKTRSFECIC